MKHTRSPQVFPQALPRSAAYLARTPAARAALYLGIGAWTSQTLSKLQDKRNPHAALMFNYTLFPCAVLVTRAFAELREEDRAAWEHLPLRQGSRALLAGAGLGSSALLAMLAVGHAQGWVTAPAWGWAAFPPKEVARSVALTLVGHGAVAWNEEQVFRGYGYDTLSEAIGAPAAGLGMTALFALAHPIKPMTLVGEAALGTALWALRDASGGLWAPVGYHWAWNVLQTSVFGPADGPPSLRPLHVSGPALWMGRPGHPEPGLLMTLINLLVALLVWGWRRRRRM